ncbi:hypothetical protein [Nocardioides aurantiacus]|uniref:Uncharacterized protein n=1 Tax=Nocardioides aurantiacus TaxID=86796 RepID=A0A3N2CS87_9ACTN|nr:hypothetical protein [Nocardioides aurantiacus]ROR90403.1 hypothetical protein EDD33_1243 [Nocardioides aurantiacus]
MEVVFERVEGRRYRVGVRRSGRHDTGPDVPPRVGVGAPVGDVPHDLVHLAIEEALGLRLGIFGQVAAGGDLGGFFTPPPAERNPVRDQRRSRRLSRAGAADASRSESLAACVDHEGRLDPDRASAYATPREVERVQRRLGELVERWRVTPPGGELVVTWPEHLTVRRGVLPPA